MQVIQFTGAEAFALEQESTKFHQYLALGLVVLHLGRGLEFGVL
jgi:hypothetical protein